MEIYVFPFHFGLKSAINTLVSFLDCLWMRKIVLIVHLLWISEERMKNDHHMWQFKFDFNIIDI